MAQPTIPLKDPITVGDATIEAVTLRTIRAKHLRFIYDAKSDFETTFETVRAVTGLTREEADELSANDFTAISEAAVDFLPGQGSREGT